VDSTACVGNQKKRADDVAVAGEETLVQLKDAHVSSRSVAMAAI
jgi:hypothetical protein